MKGILSRQFVVLIFGFIVIAISAASIVSLFVENSNIEAQQAATFQNIEQNWLPIITRNAWTLSIGESRLAINAIQKIERVKKVELIISDYATITAGSVSTETRTLSKTWPLSYSSEQETQEIGSLTVYLHKPTIADLARQHLSRFVLVEGIKALLIILPVFFLVQMAITRQLNSLSTQLSLREKTTDENTFSPLQLQRKKIFSRKDEIDELVDSYNRLIDNIKQERENRIESERRLALSLEEKDVLMREIHHRVKNNLQIVISLLNLQSNKLTDRSAQAILIEAQNRITSMALVHEQLYSRDNLAKVDIIQYIHSLLDELSSSFQNIDNSRIETNVTGDTVLMNIDRAIPLALIINELCSNSYKHAFSESAHGKIDVQIADNTNGRITVQITDNGTGIPPDFDFDSAEGFGLSMVRTLTHQLDGELSFHSNSDPSLRSSNDRSTSSRGTSFILTIPV